MDKKKLTAENGRPIADNQNIQMLYTLHPEIFL